MTVGGQMLYPPSQYYQQCYSNPLEQVTYPHYPFRPYPIYPMNVPSPVVQIPAQVRQYFGQD